MAISEANENGKPGYTVFVSMRSKVRPGIRVQRKRAGISSLRTAQAIEKELIREVAMELAKQEHRSLMWGELVDLYELTMRKGCATQRPIQPNLLQENIRFLRAKTGDWNQKDCREITPGEVRLVLNAMERDGYSNGRLRSLKTVVNNVFRFGIDEGHLNGMSSSPAQAVKLAKYVEDKIPEILNLKQIQFLLERAEEEKHPWYPIWFTALNTGMRSGELYALLWTDIDWERRSIMVTKSWNGRMKQTKSTKSGYWRTVPMNAGLEKFLRELRARTSVHQLEVLPRAARWKNGEQARFLRDFCEYIGIPSVKFHTLRACFATHLLHANVSRSAVKKIAGWAEDKTMQRYDRLAGIDIQGATDALAFKATRTDSEQAGNVLSLAIAKIQEVNPRK